MRILAIATTALRRIVDLALVAVVVVVLLGVLLGKGAPLVGRQSIVIGGGSMEPTIALGSAIVIRPVDATTLAVGDVVSMQVGPERTTYTHRIIAILDRPDGRWLRTKGDANADPDPSLVPATAVIGRVEVVVPYAGYLLALLSRPMGVLFVLGIAATLLAIAWLLESLELEPKPVRVAGAVASGGPIQPERPAAAPSAEPELLTGEPIAVRAALPWDTAGTGRRAGRSVPAWRTAVAAGAGSSGGAVDAARYAEYARPTVREQLARSRESRNRRARWLLGREQRRPAAD
jgi:signal peptidase